MLTGGLGTRRAPFGVVLYYRTLKCCPEQPCYYNHNPFVMFWHPSPCTVPAGSPGIGMRGRSTAPADRNPNPLNTFSSISISRKDRPASHMSCNLVCVMSQRNRTDCLIATQWCDQATFSEYSPVQLERTTRACIFGRALNAANEGQQCNIDIENKKVYFMGSMLNCNKVLGMLGTYRVREGLRLSHIVVVFSSIWYNTALHALIRPRMPCSHP